MTRWMRPASSCKCDLGGAETNACVFCAHLCVWCARFYVGSDFAKDDAAGTYTSSLTRVTFQFGTPLEGFLNEQDRDGQQEELYQAFIRQFFDMLEVGVTAISPELHHCSHASSTRCYSACVLRMLAVRSCKCIIVTVMGCCSSAPLPSWAKTCCLPLAPWSLSSLLYVRLQRAFLVLAVAGRLQSHSVVWHHTQMWVHTRSLFLAAAGIVQVLFSFPLCFFVYRLVLQVKLFGALQTIAVFIILGIGAGKHASQGLPHI